MASTCHPRLRWSKLEHDGKAGVRIEALARLRLHYYLVSVAAQLLGNSSKFAKRLLGRTHLIIRRFFFSENSTKSLRTKTYNRLLGEKYLPLLTQSLPHLFTAQWCRTNRVSALYQYGETTAILEHNVWFRCTVYKGPLNSYIAYLVRIMSYWWRQLNLFYHPRLYTAVRVGRTCSRWRQFSI